MQNKSINTVLQDKTLTPSLRQIAEKVQAKKRITVEDCLYLYEKAPLGYLGILANAIREERHGNTTYFNRNFHV